MDMRDVLQRIDAAIQERKTTEKAVSIEAGMSGDGIRNWRRAVEKNAGYSPRQVNLEAVDRILGLGLFSRHVAQSTLGFAKAAPGTSGQDDLVAVYDVSASAGYGAIPSEYEEATHSLAFPPGYLRKISSGNPRDLAIISVKGESMLPTLTDDDIVMLDMSKTNLDYDGLFVLRFGDTLHVKRVTRSPRREHIKIISDNRDFYPPEDWPRDEVEVIGKVIWKGGKV